MVGIYKIKSIIDGKVYIGQSIDIKKRWADHFKLLRKGCHENRHLQMAYNKYGGNNFIKEVIETCLPECLNERELYYVKIYNSNNDEFGYNFYIEHNGFIKHRQDTIELMRQIKPCKKVYGFNVKGTLLKEWDSIKLCASELKVNTCDVRRTIDQVQITCKGYVLNNENVFRIRGNKTKFNFVNFPNNKYNAKDFIKGTNYVNL